MATGGHKLQLKWARSGAVCCGYPRAGTEVVQQWRDQSPLCSLTPDAAGTTHCRLRIAESTRERLMDLQASSCTRMKVGLNERCHLSPLLWPGCAQGHIAACVRWTEETGESHKENRVFGTT